MTDRHVLIILRVVVTILVVAVVASTVLASCKSVEVGSAEQDKWHYIGRDVYWMQVEPEPNVTCILVQKTNHSVGIDCYEVAR